MESLSFPAQAERALESFGRAMLTHGGIGRPKAFGARLRKGLIPHIAPIRPRLIPSLTVERLLELPTPD